jgi:hypothetical protein
MPDWRFRMMYDGEFTKPAGVIYESYDDSYAQFDESGKWIGGGNLVKPFTIPSTWMRDLGVDFGPVNCGRLWVAEDPRTHYYFIFRESLGGGLTHPEYAREVLSYQEPMRHIRGGSGSEDELRKEWTLGGLAVIEPLISEVEAGIDHANGLFKQHRAFVFDTNTRFRSELGTYSRELDAAGEPTAKIADKQKFHELDCWRYIASMYPIDGDVFSVPTPPYDPSSRTLESYKEHAKQAGLGEKKKEVTYY